MSTILLKVCISITIHKSQGINIGPNKIFEHVVIHPQSDIMKKTPGIYLVALSISMNSSCFYLGNVFTELKYYPSQKLVHHLHTQKEEYLLRTFKTLQEPHMRTT